MIWIIPTLIGLSTGYGMYRMMLRRYGKSFGDASLSTLVGIIVAGLVLGGTLTVVIDRFPDHPAAAGRVLSTDVEKTPSVVTYQVVDPPPSVVSTSSSHGTIYDLPAGLLGEEAVVVEGQKGFYTLETLPDGTREYKEKMYRADLVRIIEDAQRAQTAEEYWVITETTKSRDLGNYRWLWWPLRTFSSTARVADVEKVVIYLAPVEASVGPVDNYAPAP